MNEFEKSWSVSAYLALELVCIPNNWLPDQARKHIKDLMSTAPDSIFQNMGPEDLKNLHSVMDSKSS